MRGSFRKKNIKIKRSAKKVGQRSPVRLGILVLVSLLLLILGGKFLSLVWRINQPFSPEGIVGKQNTNEEGTLNLVVKSQDIYVLSFNPVDKSATVLKVPEETYVNLPFGYGSWPMRSVYQLGEAEKPVMGAKLLESTIESTFGVPINGYVLLSDTSSLNSEELIEKLRQDPLALDLLLKSNTDLSLWQIINFWLGMRGVRFDKVKFVDLAQSSITSWTLLSDKSRVLSIDQVKLDQYLQDKFIDNKLKDEGLTVGIFNSTDHSGLADKAARMVNNIGGQVIFTTNSQVKLSKTVVLGKSSYTLQKMVGLFAASCKKTSDCDDNLPNIESSRADVNIILGEDYYMLYNTR